MSAMMNLLQARDWIPGARLSGAGEVMIQRVHTDSRSLEPGDLFIALQGEHFDAQDFLAEAKAKGAVAVICQDETKLQQAGLPGLIVANSTQALAALAKGWRAQFKLPLIAVTGSNGKTTVTQMLASILRAFKPQTMLATQGNFNNEIGVALTLLRLREHHDIAVLELGMNHPGEISTLADMAQPTVALVNNAQREHMEFMATIEAVARENAAVIEALAPTGVAVFPADDTYSPLWRQLSGERAHFEFSMGASSSAIQLGCELPLWDDGCWQVQAHTPVGALRYSLRIAGLHNVKNSLAAMACALAAGVAPAAITQGLDNFTAVKGRSSAKTLQFAGRRITLIDDSYNANPDSVRAAIEVLAGLPGPRLLVLGDMGEVGNEGPRFHAEIGAYARDLGIDVMLTLGTASAMSADSFGAGQHFLDIDALNRTVLELMPTLSSILVKGSRFMKMERVTAALTALATAGQEDAHAA